jgi:hypothetical protein
VAIWYILLQFGMFMLCPFGIFYCNLVICCGHLVFDVAIWYMLWPFGICCGHLVYVVAIWYILWYIFPRFGMLYKEKSGNPGWKVLTNFSVPNVGACAVQA